MDQLLKQENLSQFLESQQIPVPKYDRENTKIGIVHLGPGAFHRAHQAVYTENAMNLSGGNWGICGVSLRSPGARDILKKQDNLYTLAILDKKVSYQIIGAIKEILVASEETRAVISRMANPDTKIITLTITEKGYCLASDGSLDSNHIDIKHDLANPQSPVSAIGFIVAALKQRKENSIPACNILSCDNVSGNGDKLRRAVLDFAKQLDSTLSTWIADHVAFPNSMVDSITPKTESYTISNVSSAIKLLDNWPIQREEFSQWVIEDSWQGERPDWQSVGVIYTNDVEGFEKAKLRLLNCLHSTLAYAGSLAGYKTVFEVTSDKGFYQFITRLAREEIIGSFTAPKELEVNAYSDDIIQRFLNPEIRHLLAQIAFDGSQKVQMRIIPTIADNLALGRSTILLCFSLACWFEFVCRAIKQGDDINDPLASTFATMPALRSENVPNIVDEFLNIEAIFGKNFNKNQKVKCQLIACLQAIRLGDVKQITQIIDTLIELD